MLFPNDHYRVIRELLLIFQKHNNYSQKDALEHNNRLHPLQFRLCVYSNVKFRFFALHMIHRYISHEDKDLYHKVCQVHYTFCVYITITTLFPTLFGSRKIAIYRTNTLYFTLSFPAVNSKINTVFVQFLV